MLEAGEHSVEFVRKKRGLEPLAAAVLKRSIEDGCTAKEAVKRSRQVESAAPGGVVSLKPTNDELQLDLKRASNMKYQFKKDVEEKFGLKTSAELLEYLAVNKTTKALFDSKGSLYDNPLPNYVFITSLSSVDTRSLHIFDSMSTYDVDPETQQRRVDNIYIVFGCKSLLENVLRQREGVKEEELGCCADATFCLLKEGWVVSTIGCNTLYEDTSNKTRHRFRPFLFMLSKTERGDAYAFLFRTLVEQLFPWLGITGLQKSGFKIACSDHHDGLIRAYLDVLQVGMIMSICI